MGNLLTEKQLGILNRGDSTDALVESPKGDVFDEVEAIHLYQIHLSSKLDSFGFFAANNGTDVLSVDTDNAFSLPGCF